MAILQEGLKRFIPMDSKIIEVCDKYIHPSYDGWIKYDIAILKFCQPIKLSNEIHPISLKTPKCNKNIQSKEKGTDKKMIYMAGRMDLNPASTLTNVVDLSLIEFKNVHENQQIQAKNFLVQKGDSGYALWWTDEECNQPYQVSLHITV